MRRDRVVGILRQLFVCFALTVLARSNSFAQSLGTTFSDLWWNPAESGWGVTVDHQQDVMFLTFFIYRSDGSPYWVTALLNRTSGATAPFVFTGGVYENSGPYYGDVFNPARVGVRQVGTATFSASQLDSATLAYSINGVAVTKALQREALQNLDFSGTFNGIFNYQLSNCPNPVGNGHQVALGGPLTILHNGSEIQMLFRPTELSDDCGFVGTYLQAGSIGSATGKLSCSDGTTGTFTMAGLQWTIFGVSAAISIKQDGGCDATGFIGGTGVH